MPQPLPSFLRVCLLFSRRLVVHMSLKFVGEVHIPRANVSRVLVFELSLGWRDKLRYCEGDGRGALRIGIGDEVDESVPHSGGKGVACCYCQPVSDSGGKTSTWYAYRCQIQSQGGGKAPRQSGSSRMLHEPVSILTNGV